jgi:hypothetical protein
MDSHDRHMMPAIPPTDLAVAFDAPDSSHDVKFSSTADGMIDRQTDLQALLTALTPAVWQESPWHQWADASPLNRRQATLEWLQQWCFVQSMGIHAVPPQRSINDRHNGLSRSLTQNLHGANCGRGYWDAGWEIVACLPDRYFHVVRQGLLLEVEQRQHLPTRRQPYQVGDRVSIKLPKNLVVDDYYVAVGDAGLPSGECVELFFHLEAAGAPLLIQPLTTAFNAAQKPLRLAVSHTQEAYPRRDAGILTIAIADYAFAAATLAALYPELQPHLQPSVPLFSLPIAPGIGLLEPTEPAMQRYQCLATVLLTLYLAADDDRPTSATVILNALAGQLSAAGFIPDYWHCCTGNRSTYQRLNLAV